MGVVMPDLFEGFPVDLADESPPDFDPMEEFFELDVDTEEEEEEAPDPPLFNFSESLPDHEGRSLDALGGETPVCFVTGQAGTGKTTLVRQKLLDDPTFGLVTATTGVAAVNLGGITINSALGYSTTEVLRDNYIAGYLAKKLKDIRKEGYRWLICDEGSMMSKKTLDFIMLGLRQINEDHPADQPLGLMLIADFGQLPPIGDVLYLNGKPVIERGREKKESTPWVFESDEWPLFDAAMIKLDKVHRQSDQGFLAGINAIRKGQGNIGVGLLKSAGVEFRRALDPEFDGTTLMAKNDEVDRMNLLRLKQLPGTVIRLPNERWSARKVQPSEWKSIPDELQLKEGAYVMILTNNPPLFSYVNGDCGHVRDLHIDKDGSVVEVGIELIRNGELVYIPKVSRKIEQRGEPDEEEKKHLQVRRKQVGRRLVWVLGEIDYWPIRLAYGSTVHKSQGLSLDRVQIDPRAHFFGANNMAYVAVSRARTPGGLVVVGDPRALAEKVKSDPKIKRFL